MTQLAGYREFDTDRLVGMFVDGDMGAFDELVHRHRHLPLAAARRHLSSNSDVDDVAQETWCRFASHASRLRDRRALAKWLWVTATNEAHCRQNRSVRQQLVDHFDDRPAEDASTEDVVSPERRDAVCRAALARLTASERELLVLLMDERGLSYSQISASTHRPVGAIGPTRARIIDKLRSDPHVARLFVAA